MDWQVFFHDQCWFFIDLLCFHGNSTDFLSITTHLQTWSTDIRSTMIPEVELGCQAPGDKGSWCCPLKTLTSKKGCLWNEQKGTDKQKKSSPDEMTLSKFLPKLLPIFFLHIFPTLNLILVLCMIVHVHNALQMFNAYVRLRSLNHYTFPLL